MAIIVTGGLGVLGRAVVSELKERGTSVAVVDLAQAADSPADVVLGGIDLGDENAVAAAYADIAEKLGGIDGLVNTAGGFLWETVAEGALASWDRMYAMNVRTAVISSRAALPHLRKNGGAIVNIGAAGAAKAAMGMGAYAASKTGVMALTESLADELRGQNIRVNAILPTILDTPTNRRDMPDADTSAWVRPEAAAKAIAFLLSADAGTITGVGIPLSVKG
ncbi:MAG: SDR family NAD(P)-dependent oxidoreductase [Sphingomonadaceae bacterium]